MYSSTSFDTRICIYPQNHHRHQESGHICCFQKFPPVSLECPPDLHPVPIDCFTFSSSVSMKTCNCAVFIVCIHSRNIIYYEIDHVDAWGSSLLHVAKWYSIIWMNHKLAISSSVSGHLGIATFLIYLLVFLTLFHIFYPFISLQCVFTDCLRLVHCLACGMLNHMELSIFAHFDL